MCPLKIWEDSQATSHRGNGAVKSKLNDFYFSQMIEPHTFLQTDAVVSIGMAAATCGYFHVGRRPGPQLARMRYVCSRMSKQGITGLQSLPRYLPLAGTHSPDHETTHVMYHP